MSFQLLLLDRMFRLRIKRRFQRNPDVISLRPILASMIKMVRRPPPHVHVETIDLDGVTTERVKTANADESRAILYIHGGGMVSGAASMYRALTWRLSAGVRAPVYAVDYRLAPEHPFPAGLDEVVSAYQALLKKGIAPGKIAVAGDSAGGNLTLAMALKLKALGLPQPAALVSLSPVTDMLGEFPSRRDNARSDAMFDQRTFPTVVNHYCPGADARNPLISPLYGDVSGLPPTLLQCSGAEMLRDDSVKMAERLSAAGVPTTLEIWPKVFHVWQIAADFLPEGRHAIDNIVAFVNARLAT